MRARRPHPFRARVAIERQVGQHVQRPGHVEQLRIGVGLHREFKHAVTHRGLCGPGSDTALAQVGREGVSQRVNVERPAAVVALVDALPAVGARHQLGDARGDKVAVQDADQPGRHVEQPSIGRELRRDRPAGGAGLGLHRVEPVPEPRLQVSGKVGPERNLRPACIGFDLNPLAVMAARTNYLIAIRGLLDGVERVEIPVYLCDSILTPSTYGGLFAGATDAAKELKTAAARFIVPTEIAQSRDDVAKYADVLEACVRNGYSPAEFLERCTAEGLPVSAETLHADLYKQLVELDKQSKNGVWARIIKNSFAPLFVGRVDFVVGNPPWVNVENLPKGYLREIDPLWDRYGLKHTLAGPQIGSSKRDICALFVYSCADYYLHNVRRLGFVLTQSLFKSKGGGDGFRRFSFASASETVYLRPVVVHDLSDCDVFAGAVNRTSVLVVERSQRAPQFPVRYVVWRPREDSIVGEEQSLDEVQAGMKLDVLDALPSDPARPTSPWLTLSEAAVASVVKLRGKCAYRAYTGAYTGGLNGAYWLKEVGRRGRAVVYGNLFTVGKKPVPEVTSPLEGELVFPLVRGRDVKRWVWTSQAMIIVPFDQRAGTWISEGTMKAKFPKAYDYFGRFEKELRARKTAIVRQQMQRGPFYAMVAVGSYTFAPWKVLFKRLSNSVQAVVAPREAVPHEKLLLVGCESESEAQYVAGVLNSDPVNVLLRGSAVRVQTIEYAPSDIAKIKLAPFDESNRNHLAIAEAAMQCTQAASQGATADLDTAGRRLNAVVARLLGLSKEETAAIAAELAYLESGGRDERGDHE